MHKGVPEASTQAVSLCLLGTHLRTSTHVHFFVYMCVFYMCARVYMWRNARLCSLMCRSSVYV